MVAHGVARIANSILAIKLAEFHLELGDLRLRFGEV